MEQVSLLYKGRTITVTEWRHDHALYMLDSNHHYTNINEPAMCLRATHMVFSYISRNSNEV